MEKNMIRDLALIYVKIYAPKQLSPEQFIEFFDDVQTKMSEYYDAHTDLHTKWHF